MKKYLHILFLSFVTLLAGKPALAQNPYDLPMACVGSLEEYWVEGFNGMSDFTWRVIGPNSNDVSDKFIPIDRGDTILMNWSADLPGGIYTFEVIEVSDFGCTGEAYTQDIMLNSSTINIPFDGVPESVTICEGDIAELDPGDFLSYLWQDGSSNRIFYTGEAGTYQVQLVNSNYSCTYNEMETFVNPLPEVWLGNDTVLFGAQTLLLDVYNPNFDSYYWSPTGSISSSITVEGGFGDQVISVTVTDMNGCSNSDTIMVSAADYSNLRIPAAFTPNGDGVNDTWIFPAQNEAGAHLYPYLNDVDVSVFNRWGKMVWQSKGMFREWDGRDLGGRALPMDSYHYIIRIKIDSKVFTYKGTVTIIR